MLSKKLVNRSNLLVIVTIFLLIGKMILFCLFCFGIFIDDIAFYNEKNEYILFTTTHEGYITVNKDIIKE